jgi:hypothetical protein
MNDLDKNTVDLTINIQVPDRYSDTGHVNGLQEAAGSYANTLFASLGLPRLAKVKVVPVSANDPGADNQVRIDLNGYRLHLTPGMSSVNEDPVGLQERVANAIYRGRRHAVNDEVARSLWRQWLPDEEPPAVGDRQLHPFVELLGEAVRYGFETTRFKDYVDRISAPDASMQTAHAIVEEVLGSAEKAGGYLFLTPEKYEEYQVSTGSSLTEERMSEGIPEMLTMLSDGLFYELGLNYGLLVCEDENLADGCFRLQINDMRLPVMVSLGADEVLVNDTVDRLELLQIEGRPAINPANGAECAIVSNAASSEGIFDQQGLTTWGSDGFMILSISSEIRSAAGAFLTSAELYTDQLAAAFPDLINCARLRFGIPAITRILRNLLDEEISIRDLRTILDGLLAVDGVTTADVAETIVFSPNTGIKYPSIDSRPVSDLRTAELAECVRTVLKRFISYKYTRGGSTLVVYLVDPEIEELIRANMDRLEKADRERIIDAVHGEVGTLMSYYQMPVILTTMDVRRSLRLLLDANFPALAVLSYQELSPDMNIQPIARISFDS